MKVSSDTSKEGMMASCCCRRLRFTLRFWLMTRSMILSTAVPTAVVGMILVVGVGIEGIGAVDGRA